MKTYWVRYSFNIDIEPSGVTSPARTPLTFQGQNLVYGSGEVSIVADPTPAPLTTYDAEFYYDLCDLGVSNPKSGQYREANPTLGDHPIIHRRFGS